MSIPMIKSHSQWDGAVIRPDDFPTELIRKTIFARSRFHKAIKLIRSIEMISDEDFTECTNKYYISASHINDAYIAVLAIYNCIQEKQIPVGKEIKIHMAEKKAVQPLAIMSISESEDDDDEDAHTGEAPVIHMLSGAYEYEICRDILMDDKVEFFVSCTPDGGQGKSPQASGCCRCITIDACSDESPRDIMTDYFLDKEFDIGEVEDDIDVLINALGTSNEYVINSAARQVITNHLFNGPDSRTLSAEDFTGIAGLFSEKPQSVSIEAEIVGLEREKEKLMGIIDSISIDLLRTERGLTKGASGCNIVFAGPPGTAKTTLARRFAQCLEERRIIRSKACFKECVKSDIVGYYVGQTAVLVDKLFSDMAANGGGVIFFDEIYTLSENDSTSFDREAVTCIVQNMENYRDKIFCIFAGYEEKMTEFLSSNPGLSSRIPFTINFGGYSNETLIRIFGSIAAAEHYKIAGGCNDIISDFFGKLRICRGERFGNGREARNLFINAKQKHALRISGSRKMTAKMLTEISREDISEAISDILLSESGVRNVGRRIGF